MDILGSILGSMEKPPEDKEKKKAREDKARLEKLQQREKQKLNEFRTQILKRVNEFVKDPKTQKYKFEAMDKTCRAIAHEVADVAGLVSFSFGQDEIDRYVMIWKKEFAPCNEEVLAYRNEQEWDPEKARLKAEQMAMAAATSSSEHSGKRKHNEQQTPTNYQQKYEHILGKEAAKDAARTTSANKSYGNVPSENKRDQRTIEQVMADSQAKKRQKVEFSSTSSVQSSVKLTEGVDFNYTEQIHHTEDEGTGDS